MWGKLCKLRKSCHHKRNINEIYNEQLQYNCYQPLPTLRLKTQELRKSGNSDERKLNTQTAVQHPVFLLVKNPIFTVILLKIAKKLYSMQVPGPILSPTSKKFFKKPRRNFLYIRKLNFLAPRLKDFLLFQKWNFLMELSEFDKKKLTQKKFLLFREMELSSPIKLYALNKTPVG